MAIAMFDWANLTVLAALLASAAAAQPVAMQPNLTPPAATVPADPELSRPLTPLSEFAVEPVAPDAPGETRPAVIRYDITVNGLGGTGVSSRFDALSTLRESGRRGDSTAQITARADEDVKLLTKLLHAEGFSTRAPMRWWPP